MTAGPRIAPTRRNRQRLDSISWITECWQPYPRVFETETRRRRRIDAAFFLTVFLVVGYRGLGSMVRPNVARAQDISAYSVMPQFGHDSAPTAIAIAPNGRWFATAKSGEIYLSDMRTGEILRRIAAPDGMRYMTLSKDGALVLGRDDSGGAWAWKAETGAAIPAAEAASAEASDWNDLQHLDVGMQLDDDRAARNYLSKMGIDGLAPRSKLYKVLATNQADVVEVDFEIDGGEAGRVGTAFIDAKTKKLLVRYAPEADGEDCGEPWGTFAFNGRMLVLAPTARDASQFFRSAEVIDVAADPPKVEWKRPCLDFMVSGIEMERGLILASADPTQTTIWDPASGKAVARLTDIGPAENDEKQALAISGSRHTIAYARMVEADKNIYGVSVLLGGATKFLPTDRRVTDVRLSADGLDVFGETETGWKAWDVSTGQPLRGEIEPPEASNRRAERKHSPDGKFRRIAVGSEGDGRRSRIVDSAGRSVVIIDGEVFFSDDSRHAWSLSTTQEQSIILWELKTGKPLWTATDQDGDLVMEFPDGRVRLSEGAEKMVRLVHGFDARPFDGAAARRFLER